MPKTDDSFGQLLWDSANGDWESEVLERDDGFIDVLDPHHYFTDYGDWPEIEKKALKLVRGKVLDIGCGAGRHSIFLQLKGFDVLGIDSSPLAVKVSRMRGLKKAKLMSISRLDLTSKFDTVIMFGNNLGLLGGEKRGKRILRELARVTSPGAIILGETADPRGTKKLDHLRYQQLNRKKGRMNGQIRIRVRYRRLKGPWFDYLLMSKDELKWLVKGTGWRVRRFISSRGPRYIAVLEKSTRRDQYSFGRN